MSVEGKVALVTGASRGIGRAIAIALAQAGADVACAARATDASPLRLPGTIDETARQVEAAGRRALAIPVNLAVEHEIEAMVNIATEHFGRVDILINNAAVTFAGDLDIPLRRYDLIMTINVRAPLLAVRAAAPAMIARRTGTILNVSSIAAQYPYPGLMAYGMSKAALDRFTIDVAEQLQPHGIAVNGFRIDVPVASEGFAANLPGADQSEWEPSEVPAEGVVWMLNQPPDYTGRIETMTGLREAHGIMASRAKRPFSGSLPPL